MSFRDSIKGVGQIRISMGLRSVVIVILAGLAARTVQQTTDTAGDVKPPSVSSEVIRLELAKFPAISVLDNILYFASWEHVAAAQRYLEAKQAEYNYRAYIDSQSKFNPAQAYQEFEAQYGFSSLRRKVDAEFQTWLNSDSTSTAKNPEESVVPGEGLQTVLNTYSEVNVGKVFYRVSIQGATSFANFFDLVARRSDSTALVFPNPSPVSQCVQTSIGFSRPQPQPANNYSGSLSRIVGNVRHWYSVTATPPGYFVEARVRIFDRPSIASTNWFPFNGPVRATAWGYVSSLYWDPDTNTIYPDLCFGQFGYNLNKLASVSGTFVASHQIRVNYKTKLTWTNGDLLGLHLPTQSFHEIVPLNV